MSHKLCWECRMRLVEYMTTPAGQKLKHGLCRDCYERGASRIPPKGHRGDVGRTNEMKELVSETKFGTNHG